jgi:hypothetical protein
MTVVVLATKDVTVFVKLEVDETKGMLTRAGCCIFEGVDTLMKA